jgi:hypothetical protein
VVPPVDGPRGLAAFGSNLLFLLAPEAELMSSAVTALGCDEAVESWVGPRPANLELAGFVPQCALPATCDRPR